MTDGHFVGKFVPPGNAPRPTTSFEFENKSALMNGVRKYMSDLTGAVGSGDSAAMGGDGEEREGVAKLACGNRKGQGLRIQVGV